MNASAKSLSAAAPLGSPSDSIVEIDVGLTARDQISLKLELINGVIMKCSLTGIGCEELLDLLAEWRTKLASVQQFQGTVSDLPLPLGGGHSAILLREAILKAQGLWIFPYGEEELCHCRAIPTQKVDEAIVSGCHSVPSVSSATSAGTSCGTCKPDIEKVLRYRLNQK